MYDYNEPYRPGEYIPAEGYRVESIEQNPMPPKQRKRRVWPKIVALCLACALLGGAGGAAGAYFMGSRGGAGGSDGSGSTVYESDREPNQISVTHTGTKELTLEEIYASWANSTVGIQTEIVTTNRFGQYTSAAAGSGFILTSDGYILTNYHVISGASSITVVCYDGTEYSATLVGGEENNDIAVLKIGATGLQPVILGDSDAVQVGETVCAIGNPLGELTFSLTHGVVSAKDRTVTFSSGSTLNVLQTDCTINSGNSGGPLFNTYGEVIGITNAKYSNNGSYDEATIEGIGFAIPINDVIDMVKDIIEVGHVTGKPSMGILHDTVDAAVQRYGIPAGAEIMAVLEGSCADTGGLQVGDIVTAVDGTAVSTRSEMSAAVQKHKAGDTVSLTVYRNGETMELTFVLDELTPEREAAMDDLNETYNQSQQSSDDSSGNGFSYYWPFW